MDTAEKVPPATKRGRKPKVKTEDVATPLGQYQIDAAAEARETKNPVVDKWYELIGTKLCLKKKKESGRVTSEYIGNVAENRNAPKEYQEARTRLLVQVEKLEKEGRLKRRL